MAVDELGMLWKYSGGCYYDFLFLGLDLCSFVFCILNMSSQATVTNTIVDYTYQCAKKKIFLK